MQSLPFLGRESKGPRSGSQPWGHTGIIQEAWKQCQRLCLIPVILICLSWSVSWAWGFSKSSSGDSNVQLARAESHWLGEIIWHDKGWHPLEAHLDGIQGRLKNIDKYFWDRKEIISGVSGYSSFLSKSQLISWLNMNPSAGMMPSQTVSLRDI